MLHAQSKGRIFNEGGLTQCHHRFIIIFYELMYPDYNADMVSVLTEKLSEQGLSKQEINEKIEEQTKYYSTALQSQFAFTGNLITGLAFSLLLSLFLKSKNSY